MNYEAGLSNKMKDVLLGDIVELITNKVNVSEISLNNYISTDNMLPNCGGVTQASSLPSADKFNAFSETDTLFSNIRTYFRKVWFAGFSGGASPDVLIFRSKNESFLDPHFLYYLISNKTFIDYTDLTSKGAKMPRGDKDAIAKFPVKLPQINEQKAIASVLGALDDKIQNNHQINETLEEMARSIFKSWFVDFDPIHAKIDGNKPAHMDKETTAIFPNSFGNDGLPVGWKNSCISKLAFRVKDKFKRGQKWDNEKLIDLGRMPSNSIALNEFGEGKELSTSINIFKKNDFLFGSIRPYFCKAGLAPFNGITNSSVFILRCHENKNRALLYALCSSQNIFNKSIQYSKGTKMPIISWTDFSKFECIDPTQIIRDVFNNVTIPMFDKIQNNVSENHTLAELRDTLLPKLICGEICVKNAEREVEESI